MAAMSSSVIPEVTENWTLSFALAAFTASAGVRVDSLPSAEVAACVVAVFSTAASSSDVSAKQIVAKSRCFVNLVSLTISPLVRPAGLLFLQPVVLVPAVLLAVTETDAHADVVARLEEVPLLVVVVAVIAHALLDAVLHIFTFSLSAPLSL